MNKQLSVVGIKMEFDIRVPLNNLTQKSAWCIERRAEDQGQSLVELQTAACAVMRGLTQF